MDCDDFMMELAKMGDSIASAPQSAGFRDHAADCAACSDLARDLAEEVDDELLGQQIGVYRIQHLLGEGGMGRVYLATHPEILSRVAIKVFSRDWNAHPNLVSRFFAEARATNVIGHENIVNVLDVGRLEDGRPFMVMEHLSGHSLADLVGATELSDADTKRLMLDVLSALAAAHERSIVHRDLKPDNIFVSPEGRATLLDFGIAKLIPESGGGTLSSATATGLILGTPQYMSPEQATGDVVDHRTDVYAMGIILYECFTGQRPFEGTSLYRLLEQHVHVSPLGPRELRPDLPVDVEAVILRALEKTASDRYQNMSDMRAALDACEVSETSGGYSAVKREQHVAPVGGSSAVTVPGRPQPAQAKSEPPQRRSPYALGGLVLAAVAIPIGVWQVVGQGEAPRVVATPADAALSANAPPPMGIASDAAASDAAPSGIVDAAIPSLDSGTAKRQPKRKPALRGTAPLSRLDEAMQIARGLEADARLFRITLQGIDMHGRVDTSEPRNHIYFDFVSARLVERNRDRKFGNCIVRVWVRHGRAMESERLTSQCTKLNAFAPPRCSIASLLRKKRKSGAFPESFEPTKAVLRQASAKRSGPTWIFSIKGINFGSDPCPD
jgi:serine/threonine-protein kinase